MKVKFKVKFSDIDSGWVNVFIISDNQTVLADSISYVPYDTLGDLVDVLDMLYYNKQSSIEKVVIMNTEPLEYELRFHQNGTNIVLDIYEYPDCRRIPNTETHLFSINGDYELVCKPFWRALRNMESLHTPEELSHRWPGGFPSRALNELSHKIKAHRK